MNAWINFSVISREVSFEFFEKFILRITVELFENFPKKNPQKLLTKLLNKLLSDSSKKKNPLVIVKHFQFFIKKILKNAWI